MRQKKDKGVREGFYFFSVNNIITHCTPKRDDFRDE